MKAAIITAEQIKAIEDVLEDAFDECAKPTTSKIKYALAIVRSLKVSEPVAELIGKKGHVCFQLYDSKLPINTKLYAKEQP